MKNKGMKCKCGKDSATKGMCRTCYHREWERANKNKYHDKHAVYAKEAFKAICIEVSRGLTISDACKKLKVSRSGLYRQMSPNQKKLLKTYKAIFCQTSSVGRAADL